MYHAVGFDWAYLPLLCIIFEASAVSSTPTTLVERI